MQTLNIDRRLLVPSKSNGRREDGAFCFIARGLHIETVLEAHYGRPGLCLKVFRAEATPLSEFCWSPKVGVPLTMCTKAQNLFARHGYAPRVYDIALINNEHWAQVTTYIENDGGELDRDDCRQEVVRYYPVSTRGGDPNEKNIIGSKLVDFQHHCLGHRYKPAMLERIKAATAWGSRPEPYQSIPGLGLESQRDTAHRLQMMGWDEMNLVGKTVLDVGANLGAFCHEAYVRGALRVVGVDRPHVADVAHEVANWYGYWNIDFIGAGLPAEADKITAISGIDVFDIVLALSCKQVKPLEWLFPLMGEVLFLEGHVPQREHTYREALEAEFAEVEFLGMTKDHGLRPLFRCWS
jgi:hypothetical protein